MTKPPPAFIIYVITVLREIGVGRQLTAEALRLAKHGRRNPDAVSRMAIWKSIIALALGLEGGLIYRVSLSEIATIMACRLLLARRGYRRERFYVDETQEGGDREALLALAWLMSDSKMFESHWENKLKEVERDRQNSSTSHRLWDHLGDAGNSEKISVHTEGELCAEIGEKTFSLNDDGPVSSQHVMNGATNAILSACGRLQGMLDESVELEAAATNLATYLEGNEIAAAESFLISYPDALERVLCNAQKVHRILDDMSNGELLEEQWWKWVRSVAREIHSSVHHQLELKLPLLRAEFLAASEPFGGPSRICQPSNMVGRKLREEVLLRNQQSSLSPTTCICGHPHCSNVPVAVPLIPPPRNSRVAAHQKEEGWEKCILNNHAIEVLQSVRKGDESLHVSIEDIVACHDVHSEVQLSLSRKERVEKCNVCLNVFIQQILKHNLEVESCVQRRNLIRSSSSSSSSSSNNP